MSLLTSAWALEQLAAGPQDYIYWQAYTVCGAFSEEPYDSDKLQAKHDLTVLSTFARFGVFEAVPTCGDISYADLAAKLPLTERQVRRLFRHAFTKNIFFEPRPNHVAHTALSIAPVKNRSLTPWINHNLGEILPASSRLPDAIERYGDSQDPTEVALSIAWNLEKGKGLFDWFKNDGEGPNKGWRARQFAQSMAAMDGGGHDIRYTTEGFDWGSLGEATVVDVSISTY
jgi:6-hydroxytryprostatin B O-methyltransferase